METKMMKLEIEAKSPYNDGWTSAFYAKELKRLSKRNAELAAKGGVEEASEKRKMLSEANAEMLFADGFDEALMGTDATSFCAVYDYEKCLKILVDRDGMSREEAHEFMEFNVVSAYVGDFTPSFVHVYYE